MAFALAGRLQFSDEEIQNLATEIVEELRCLQRFGEAATVTLEYLQDPEAAVRLMVDARFLRHLFMKRGA